MTTPATATERRPAPCSRCKAERPINGSGVLELRAYGRPGERTMIARLVLCGRCLELHEHALEKLLGRALVWST